MTAPTDINIIAINVHARLALASDDTECEITTLFDADGEETDDEDEAVAAVIRYADNSWFSIELSDYSEDAVN
jgi:hypothetical protein